MHKILLDDGYFNALNNLIPRTILPIQLLEVTWIVVQVDTVLYIMKDSCPHAGSSLIGGSCNKNGVLVCPLHGYKFDIKTKKSADGHQYRFKSYILHKENNQYFFYINN